MIGLGCVFVWLMRRIRIGIQDLSLGDVYGSF